MPIFEIFRSSAFRIALAFGFAMTLATTIIFGFVYLQVASSAESAVRAVLTREAENGAGFTNSELTKALDLRLTHDLRRLDYVALFDQFGRKLLGNVNKVPRFPLTASPISFLRCEPRGSPIGLSLQSLSLARDLTAASYCSVVAWWRSTNSVERFLAP